MGVKRPEKHLGVLDRGGDSPFPGVQDKQWGEHWVDSELKDEWLERLSNIPNIRIIATCAGHPAYAIPESWIASLADRLLGVIGRTSPESGPYVSYEPLDQNAVDGLPSVFGNMMVYLDACYPEEYIRQQPEAKGAIGMISVQCPRSEDAHSILERITGMIAAWFHGRLPEMVVGISALKSRPAMTKREFNDWWETVIAGLERAASS